MPSTEKESKSEGAKQEYKESRCIHVLTKGKAKGQSCGNKKMEGCDYCKSHSSLKKLNSEKVKSEGGKAKSNLKT